MVPDDVTEWLRSLPLSEPVEIDDEIVYLNVRRDGAELGAYLAQSYTSVQLREALKQGFASAIHFNAGLGETSDGKTLVLTQWLPGASSWIEAAQPLEDLLNQITQWRTAVAQTGTLRDTSTGHRNKQGLRRS